MRKKEEEEKEETLFPTLIHQTKKNKKTEPKNKPTVLSHPHLLKSRPEPSLNTTRCPTSSSEPKPKQRFLLQDENFFSSQLGNFVFFFFLLNFKVGNVFAESIQQHFTGLHKEGG